MEQHLSREEALKKLNEILDENVQENFTEQERKAGEFGHSSFLVSNRKGSTAEVGIDWDKEADELTYSVQEGEGSEV
ncbi:hypothetical protein [Virgibacillus sediminis]|uniref:PepSY domain-containing protein n=1 Tax=Virgibacillus sediminis TaxID=202260 RepID=A0ABV7A9V2_9BACI